MVTAGAAAAGWLPLSRNRRVVIAHSEITSTSRADDLDTLEEIETVAGALAELGWEPHPLPFTLDITGFVAALHRHTPAFVFNLVETVDGGGRLIHLAPAICEHLGLACTGAPATAILLTTSKLETKVRLRLAGLPTAHWLTPAELARGKVAISGPYILKPVWEDASVGIDHDGITDDPGRLVALWRERTHTFGCEFFAERFIEGRELNQALLARPRGPEALPAAEIAFQDWESEAPRIVGWRAKWDCEAIEFQRTVRFFAEAPADAGMHRRLRALGQRVWHLFGLHGYARLDVRLDSGGRLWILEVNANPCISPDAGFLAASHHAGHSTTEVVARIVADCHRPFTGPAADLTLSHPRPEPS